VGSAAHTILDVRLPQEYRGELFRPNAPPEAGQRAGDIPSAVHVPWEAAINKDGTFKSLDELRTCYLAGGVIPYCTVGGRSSLTWFVLSQIVGYPRVRLYEASWAEWGRPLACLSSSRLSAGRR
jgi:thiosulfate/3-mercaptopyruvate sulfurtransferase